MAETNVQFVGSIPENYDRGLGPNIFADYAEDLALRAGRVGAGSVLELAAGTGIVSRKLRDVLAPEVKLVVTDLNPPMLDVARSKFRVGERVEFAEADAMALPFTDAEFDVIVCQFGVMFFPDKVASFREAARVLRPGGHYVFNTWGTMSANPFSEIGHEVTARFFRRVAYDLNFGGIATEGEEGERIARTVGNHRTVVMQNHGVTTLGATVAEAWDALYHLERAAKTLVLAYSTGQPLKVMSDDMAEAVAEEWQVYKDAEFAHFAEMKRVLDRGEPDYKD